MGRKKVIEQFWDINLIKEPSDIFDLNYNKIEKLEVGAIYQSII